MNEVNSVRDESIAVAGASPSKTTTLANNLSGTESVSHTPEAAEATKSEGAQSGGPQIEIAGDASESLKNDERDDNRIDSRMNPLMPLFMR